MYLPHNHRPTAKIGVDSLQTLFNSSPSLIKLGRIVAGNYFYQSKENVLYLFQFDLILNQIETNINQLSWLKVGQH